MSLYLYSHPFENSLFDVFDNDVFNNDVFNNNIFDSNNNDDFFDSLIPYKTFTHPCRSSICRRIRRNNRWSPYKKLEKQLKKYFNEYHQKSVDFTPNINLTEDEKNYYIHANLPGMTKDHVNMELNSEDRILTISGERKSIYKNNNDEDQKEEKDPKQKEEEKNEEVKEKGSNDDTKESNEKETKETKETKLTKQDEKLNEIQKKNNCHYSVIESSYSTFSRSFSIPEDADINSIKAKMENGVLEVTINKIEEQKNKNRSIQIQ